MELHVQMDIVVSQSRKLRLLVLNYLRIVQQLTFRPTKPNARLKRNEEHVLSPSHDALLFLYLRKGKCPKITAQTPRRQCHIMMSLEPFLLGDANAS